MASHANLDPFDDKASARRKDYLSWEEYFMSLAFLSSMRSKDPCTQVGACIVDSNNKIVSMGYNGMPIGIVDEKFPWSKDSDDPLKCKYLYVCHAELNAILNKNSIDISGCTIYCTLFPCNECTKVIIQSRISEVVYFLDDKAGTVSNTSSKLMLDSAGIPYRRFIPSGRKIIISLDSLASSKICS